MHGTRDYRHVHDRDRQPQQYGGNYRYYNLYFGSVNSGQSWDYGGAVLQNYTYEQPCGGEGGCFAIPSGAPFVVYLPPPAQNDTVVFGFLGPTGCCTGGGPPGSLSHYGITP